MSSGTIRRVVVICLVYVAVTSALLVWSRRGLREASWEVMERTAQLVGREIASAMAETVEQDLSEGVLAGRVEILQTIQALVERSATVRYATIVGADGRLVASNDPAAMDQSYPSPREIFGGDNRARIEAQTGSSLRRGEFRVEIPFLRRGEPYAYLRLNLMSAQIAGLYRSTYVSQLVLSGIGLIAIGMLGLMLHLQYERRRIQSAGRLAAVLSGASPTDELTDPSLAVVVEAANQLRSNLAEGELRAQEATEQLRRLDLALEVGVVVTDACGRPRIVGERARQLLGLAPSDDQDQAARVLSGLRDTVVEVARSGQPGSASLVVDGFDPPMPIEVRALPLQSEGSGAVMLQLRARDQVRFLEQTLLEAARQRGMTRLYLGVAHDLRAPINAIALNLENLKDVLIESGVTPDVEEHRQTIEMLESELQRLKRAVESLLKQTAPSDREPETFDVREIVEELEFLLRAQARQQRVELVVWIPPETLPVTAPRDGIKQAVLNLVVNAFDATPQGGRVSIGVGRKGGSVEITVSDTGTGISEEIMGRLFEMHATTKESGSGIGLSVARSAVEAAGGAMDLVRTGPDGTSIRVVIPAAQGERVGVQA